MSLFGGILGGLFGGGGTTVTQQAANNTTVNVQSILQITGLDEVLQQLGLMQAQTATAQADATKAQADATKTGAAWLAAALLAGEQAQVQQTQDLQNKMLPWVKVTLTAVVAYFAIKTWNAWR